jgi:hypothetical protein
VWRNNRKSNMRVLLYYLPRYSAPGDLQRRESKVLFETVGEYASDLHATYAVDWNPHKEALVLKQLLG